MTRCVWAFHFRTRSAKENHGAADCDWLKIVLLLPRNWSEIIERRQIKWRIIGWICMEPRLLTPPCAAGEDLVILLAGGGGGDHQEVLRKKPGMQNLHGENTYYPCRPQIYNDLSTIFVAFRNLNTQKSLLL